MHTFRLVSFNESIHGFLHEFINFKNFRYRSILVPWFGFTIYFFTQVVEYSICIGMFLFRMSLRLMLLYCFFTSDTL